MRASTEGRRKGIQWTLCNQLDDLDFQGELQSWVKQKLGEDMQITTSHTSTAGKDLINLLSVNLAHLERH